jgi:3-phenylpropionate/trans-cinnamate dioxygenase ferredoxin component
MNFVRVAASDEIQAGTCKTVTVGGTRIVIARLKDGLYAVENRCSHANSPLITSKIYHGGQLACPVHGARFDLRTGVAKSPPAFTSLETFPVREADGQVEIGLKG